MTTSAKYQERLTRLAQFHDGTSCLVCQKPLTAHIGELPCIRSERQEIRGFYDLPIFEYAWAGLKVGR